MPKSVSPQRARGRNADKLPARRTAERCGITDEWLLKLSDSIPAKIHELAGVFARVGLCMSTGKYNIRLTVKRPGVTDIDDGATITFTYGHRTLLR
jgi:hypothetical protein